MKILELHCRLTKSNTLRLGRMVGRILGCLPIKVLINGKDLKERYIPGLQSYRETTLLNVTMEL